jgi:hypothetical protein
MAKWITGVALAALLFSGAACSTTASPSPIDVSGKWSGSTCQTADVLPVCAFSLDLSQGGSSLVGTWSMSNDRGQLTGSVSGSHVSISMNGTLNPACPVTLLSADVNGSRMTGMLGCGSPVTSFTANRQ